MSEDKRIIDINDLATGTIASSRDWVSEGLGIEIHELSHDEIDLLRPMAYQWLAENTQTYYHKVHDAYQYLPNGQPLFPYKATRGAVYLVRNPLDVVLSYANHSNISIENAIGKVCSSENAFCHSIRSQPGQLRQVLLSWSMHVMSWLEADIPKLIVRYEDLHKDPMIYFSQICEFLQIEAKEADIETAIAATRFDRLRLQEEENGFYEKVPGVKHFFRKGVVGEWQSKLTDDQIDRVVQANREAMQLVGYLDEWGHPLICPIESTY